MRLLTLSKKILLISICVPAYANIGSITEHSGSGQVTREAGSTYTTGVELGIQSYDDIRTANGRLAITFEDDTNLRLTEHSKIIVDEFVYDANPSKSKMAITFAQGTARFATGALGRVPKENISINTPTATIAIRGTDFTTTVDELGRSLVILLPDERTGQSSGEITVTNDGGTVVLNEAYQATMVSTYETQATEPVVLDIDLNLIDNLFIISPPPAIVEITQESVEAEINVLDMDALEFNELDQDALSETEEDLEFTELDMDLLGINFLEDLLDVLDKLAVKPERDALGDFGTVRIEGTLPGFDKNTQFFTIIEEGEGMIWFLREVNSRVSLRVPIFGSATIETITNGKENLITVGDGESVNIIIKQEG
jgi:hypothetical protein